MDSANAPVTTGTLEGLLLGAGLAIAGFLAVLILVE